MTEKVKNNATPVRTVISAILIALSCLTYGQVPNNEIKSRYVFNVNDPPLSTTTKNSSVEWQCVNKALTKKCLVYHNDQWFSFTVPDERVLYLNLSAQECVKKLGTQLILIEGNPCETKTYRIRQCISKLPLEDSYLKLDSLRAGTTYLLNIDGFLNDQCDFSIQLSTTPNGLPVNTNRPVENTESQVTQHRQTVRLDWRADPDLIAQLSEFQVLRSDQRAPKKKTINQQAPKLNAVGLPETNYTVYDTLPYDSHFTYNIYGVQKQDEELVLLVTRYVQYQKAPEKTISEREVFLSLNYTDGDVFKVIVMDATTSAELYRTRTVYDERLHKRYKIDLGKFVDEGKREFLIILSDYSAQGSKEMYYRLSKKGVFEKL